MPSAHLEQRIVKEVNACLSRCDATDRPFRQASAFIDLLHGDPQWTHEDIAEVQTRVLRALLDQRRRAAGSRSAGGAAIAERG